MPSTVSGCFCTAANNSLKTSYYLFDAGEQRGPMDIAEFKRLWLSGAISSEANYWYDGLASWQPLPLIITSIAERLTSSELYWQRGRSDYALFAFPCIEFIRIWPSEFGERDWAERWQRAGGSAHPSGRFLARKDDRIWERLGSTELFSDGLDHPFPPFAFGSGMGVNEVSRGESIALGIITSDTDIPGSPAERAEARRIAEQFGPELLKAAIAELEVKIKGDLVKLGKSSNAEYLRKAAGL
jgi:hypothetical protein